MNPETYKALNSVLTDRHPLPLPPEDAQNQKIRELYESMMTLREFLFSIVQGDLSQSLRRKGYLAGTLKSLQANLRHLTWQTQRIAQGDFSQRVNYMGEFSTAFNAMTQQLEEVQGQLKEARRISELRADTDGLTGLHNHEYLMKTLETEIERLKRYPHPLSIIMIDIDHFKEINDTYGHQVGNAVLAEFSKTMRCEARLTDTVGRYGGEEFMVILPETDRVCALEFAERLRTLVEQAKFTQIEISITISAGIASYTGQKQTELIRQADDRLYQAKQNGRNQIVG